MKTIMDPNEARHFASFLEDSARDLRALNVDASRQLLELNTWWRDPKYDAFQRSFEDATINISRFLTDADHYAERLREKARRVDLYLEG